MNAKPIVHPVFYKIVFLILIFVSSCKEEQTYVPYAFVQFTINLAQFNDLTTTAFSQKYEHDGYAGVIVFCMQYDAATPTSSIYNAFDAACTFEIDPECSVENTNNGVSATCPCCGTQYSLFDGYPMNDSAKTTIPLQRYNVSYYNNQLVVSNK